MRMRQQLIVVVAVVFATVAVGMNVYASTRADQRSQELAREMPVASVLSRGVFDTPRPADPSDDSTPPNHSNAPDDPCAQSDPCRGHSIDAPDPDFPNHGREVSFAVHLGYLDGVDGPLGALVRVRDVARPDIGADGPPRSDRAEERSSNDDKTPPGLTKDDPADDDSAEDDSADDRNKDKDEDEDKDKDKDEDH